MALTKTILRVLGFTGASAPAGYSEVKEGRAEISVGGQTVQVPLVHIVDGDGNSLQALTDSDLRASPVPVSGPLTDAQLRAAALPVSGPLTDAQLRSSAIQVSGPLTDAQLRAAAISVQVGNFPASQVVSGPLTDAQLRAAPVVFSQSDDSMQSYLSSFVLVPTTLTAGTAYATLWNSSTTKRIRIRKLRIMQQFIGTAAVSSSNFSLNSFASAAAPTGGTLVTADVIAVNGYNSATSVMALRVSNAGGIVPGGTQDSKVIILGSTNQLSMANEFAFDIGDTPLTLPPTGGFVLKANTAIVAGTTLRVSMIWDEI